MTRAHYWAKDYIASIAAAQQLRSSFPNLRQAYATLIADFGQTGQVNEAHVVMTEALERFGDGFLNICRCLWMCIETSVQKTASI